MKTNRHTVARLATCFVLVAAPLSAQSPPPDPWSALDGVRKALAAAGPEGAAFVQTYLPAGFSSGEAERGELALQLPDCLRWDYHEPYAKSFLLCGNLVHAWNVEDRRGQRSRVEREKEPGLDLLLLPVKDLGARYDATATALPGGERVAVRLVPKGKTNATLAEATLTVDTRAQRLVELAYQDAEGNRTRFEISGYHPLPTAGRFTPPNGITWDEP